ncbi:unnamed protein product [Pleuronectes platessa]|uniref:Uncharacterized protein n=1 Tax=Pleuronectes platessa TaxID=8262 RepID=A0A9N7VZK1_PLEPL|nr:unnamed protein product [Pleuronectes platessa]
MRNGAGFCQRGQDSWEMRNVGCGPTEELEAQFESAVVSHRPQSVNEWRRCQSRPAASCLPGQFVLYSPNNTTTLPMLKTCHYSPPVTHWENHCLGVNCDPTFTQQLQQTTHPQLLCPSSSTPPSESNLPIPAVLTLAHLTLSTVYHL